MQEVSESFDDNHLRVQVTHGKAWRAFAITVADKRIGFANTKPTYDQASALGVRIGSSKNEIETRYGHPERIVNMSQGSYYVYPNQKIIFVVSKNDKVKEWVVLR